MTQLTVTRNRGVFSLLYGVEVNIHASPAILWRILTDAKGFPSWNSTVTGIEGEIREGERIRLSVPGTERKFTPTITDVIPQERMTWTGGFAPVFKGVRRFVLRSRADGSTDFIMEERFAGLVLPLVRGSLPDFGPVFTAYANDLKREAERRAASALPPLRRAMEG